MITTGRLSGKLKPIHQRNALLLKWWSESKFMLLPTELDTLLLWWQKQGGPEECLGRFLVRHGVLDPIVLEALDMFSGGAAPPAPKQLFAGKGLVTLRQLLHQYLINAKDNDDALTPPSDRIILSPTEEILQSAQPTLGPKQAQALRQEMADLKAKGACPTPMSVRLPPEVGQRLGKCQLVERIGEGAYGIVFRATHLTLDTDVAVKVLSLGRSTDARKRRRNFQSEAKILARIQHPHLVRILDYEDDEQYPYLVLEFVAGQSLAQLLQERGKLPISEALGLILQMTEALGAAHKSGIVHRDVKPANVLVTPDGIAKLTDLGMAAFMGAEQVRSREDGICGTVSYMAPEQFHKSQVDCRSDIYSLGCSLFQMITGQLPFTGDTPFEVMMRHAQEEVPLPHLIDPQIPQPLSEIIIKMMAKFPENRYQNYPELLAALENFFLSQQPPAPAVVQQQTAPPARRSLLGWLGWGKKS